MAVLLLYRLPVITGNDDRNMLPKREKATATFTEYYRVKSGEGYWRGRQRRETEPFSTPIE